MPDVSFFKVLHTRMATNTLYTRLFGSVVGYFFNYQEADDKISSANFQKNVKSKLYHIENSKTREPPHQNLRCLQNQLFSFLILKEIRPSYPRYRFEVIKKFLRKSESVFFEKSH